MSGVWWCSIHEAYEECFPCSAFQKPDEDRCHPQGTTHPPLRGHRPPERRHPITTDETREALRDEIYEYGGVREDDAYRYTKGAAKKAFEDVDAALTKHEATIKADALYWAARKLRQGIWPENEEQGVMNAARELEARADRIESEAPDA